jgi:hypothetical protein
MQKINDKDVTQEEKELLLKEDICGRLPYGVKILYKGWDSDHGCEFTTVEDLIGIDDRFIYTLWRGERDKHSIVEPLSITDYKPYLRLWTSMTEKEIKEIQTILGDAFADTETYTISILGTQALFKYLNKKMIDYRGLIEKGLAKAAPEGMYNS